MEYNHRKTIFWLVGGLIGIFVIIFAFFFRDSSGIPGITGFRGETQMAMSEPSSAPAPAPGMAVFSDGAVMDRDESSFMEKQVIFPEEFAPSESMERLVIKTGSIGLVVEDVNESIRKLSDQVESLGGFIISSNVYDIDLAPRGYLQVRVPAEKYTIAFDTIRKEGDVKNESTNGSDVTEEFVDVEARLTNLKVTEAQFLKIMDQAVRIEDVLAVQRELSNVRAQIESLEGRKKYLEQSAKFSTILIELSTDPEDFPVLNDKDKWKPIAVVKDALRSLADFGQGIVNTLIWVAIYIPVWIILGLLAWGIWRKVKKSQK